MRIHYVAIAGICALACAGVLDCSDLIPVPPTQLISDPPPIDSNCATGIVALTEAESAINWIVADANGVYWVSATDAESGDVKGWENGNLVTLKVGDASPAAIALDENFVYWTSWNKFHQEGPSIRSWSRKTPTGVITSIDITKTPANASAGGLAVDSTNLYFGNWRTNDGGIFKLTLPLVAGEAPQQVVSGVASPYRLFVDAQNLYFNEGAGDDYIGNAVSAASLDGGAVTHLATGTVAADIALVSNNVYFTGGGLNVVDRVEISGNPVVVANVTNPLTMAPNVANNWLYFVRGDDGSGFSALVRSHLDAQNDTPQECATHLFNASAVATSGDKVYFSSQVATGYAVFELTTK